VLVQAVADNSFSRRHIDDAHSLGLSLLLSCRPPLIERFWGQAHTPLEVLREAWRLSRTSPSKQAPNRDGPDFSQELTSSPVERKFPPSPCSRSRILTRDPYKTEAAISRWFLDVSMRASSPGLRFNPATTRSVAARGRGRGLFCFEEQRQERYNGLWARQPMASPLFSLPPTFYFPAFPLKAMCGHVASQFEGAPPSLQRGLRPPVPEIRAYVPPPHPVCFCRVRPPVDSGPFYLGQGFSDHKSAERSLRLASEFSIRMAGGHCLLEDSETLFLPMIF